MNFFYDDDDDELRRKQEEDKEAFAEENALDQAEQANQLIEDGNGRMSMDDDETDDDTTRDLSSNKKKDKDKDKDKDNEDSDKPDENKDKKEDTDDHPGRDDPSKNEHLDTDSDKPTGDNAMDKLGKSPTDSGTSQNDPTQIGKDDLGQPKIDPKEAVNDGANYVGADGSEVADSAARGAEATGQALEPPVAQVNPMFKNSNPVDQMGNAAEANPVVEPISNGAADTTAADATAAGTTTTGATVGETAAATEAGSTAAAETAGTVAGGSAATGVGIALVYVIVIILVIIILIGVAGFFLTMPQFLWNKLKNMAVSLWTGFYGYFVGMDEATVHEDDIKAVAQYLHDMGYDLVGMGFAESVELNERDRITGKLKDEDVAENQVLKVDAPYLRAYLVAENRTYMINNYTFNINDAVAFIFKPDQWSEGVSTWGTGLIELDHSFTEALMMPFKSIRIGEINVGELIDGVKIERSSNTLRIRRLNFDWFNTHNDYTYYSLKGWSGRYGKPFELSLTLHVATMAPDLVREIAMNDKLDAKVYIKMKKSDINGTIKVDGRTIDELEASGTYDEDTIKELRNFESKNISEIKTKIPYISSVRNHWFRNVYFEGTKSYLPGGHSGIEVGVDEDEDGIEDYNEERGPKTQKSRPLTAEDSVYSFGDTTDTGTFDYSGDEAPDLGGAKITIEGTFSDGVIQTKDAVRGLTNPTTKELFKQKYYIYDGTVEKAEQIQEARARHDDTMKEEVRMTKESLSAFSILESSETLDAQYIYRDLKELVIELGYFEREDFDAIEKQVLEWPVPDYVPAEWPDRKTEKQIVEYGTLIASEESVANAHNLTVDDIRKITRTEEEKEDNYDEDDYKRVLKRSLFIGDSYIVGLENSKIIEDSEFAGESGVGPQYWLDNISKLPEKSSKIIIYLGVNTPEKYEAMKNLLDALRKKYETAEIYVIEVMHLGKNYNNVDEYNKKIDTFNGQIRNKCKIMKGVRFIDASLGLVQNGYLANPTADGIHITDYDKWARNIALAINDLRTISTNPTDEEKVIKLLEEAKQITDFVRENGFDYGAADFMPPNEEGYTTKDNKKVISCDRMVAWALYNIGYKDQPENGLCVSERGTFIEYCEEKEWEKITDIDKVQAGDIVFCGQLDEDGKKARHVFICAGENKRYDCGLPERIKLTGQFSGYTEQPFNEPISSDFMCAYRITGKGVINTGLKPNIDVIAMCNGTVTEVYADGENLFSSGYLSKQIYGEDLTKTDESIFRPSEQTDEGLRIRISDNALRNYQLVMYGFDVKDDIAPGQTIRTNDIIGKTKKSDICLILIDTDKAVCEDIEKYIKVPKKTQDNTGASPQPYVQQPGDDVLLANMMHHEGCTNGFQSAAYGSYSKDEADRINMMTGYVLINRALVNYGGHGTTLRDQLLAPGQYATAYVADIKEIHCLDCYENAKLCLTYDCDYVKNPEGEKMTRDVLGQSGWDQCPDNSSPGKNCFWWVDDNKNGIPEQYTGPGSWFDEFFCYNAQYAGYR